MTTRELAKYIDRKGLLYVGDEAIEGKLACAVTVLDIRKSRNGYGIDLLVTPIEGDGEAWVDAIYVHWDRSRWPVDDEHQASYDQRRTEQGY
jgi:hypothetical protein